MKDKIRIASVRPSPFSSIAGIIALIAMLVFGISSFRDTGGGFLILWVLAGIGGIIYFLLNLSSYSKSEISKVPLTAEDVIEINTQDDEQEGKDFETRLKKIESLKKDGLISEKEYQHKREDIMKEKW